MGAIWYGFKSKPWNPVELAAERQQWEAKHLPKLRAATEAATARREAGKAALAAITPDHRAAIVAAYGRAL